MASRIRMLGVALIIVGLVSWAAALYAYTRVQDGADSLQGFSEAQNVTLSYNEDGELIDRGTTEGADAIMALLTDEWSWPVNEGELDPDDPVVNTGSEYMFQMATIAQHTLHGTQTVVLAEQAEYDGDGDGTVDATATVYTPLSLPDGVWDPEVEGYVDAVFEPGVYKVPVNGRYWTAFNRTHPLDGPTRSQAWSGTVHGLFGELGVGAATFSSLEMGQGVALVTALMGLGFVIAGGGLVWVGYAKKPEEEEAKAA